MEADWLKKEMCVYFHSSLSILILFSIEFAVAVATAAAVTSVAALFWCLWHKLWKPKQIVELEAIHWEKNNNNSLGFYFISILMWR